MGALDWTLLANTTIITVGTIANGLGVAWIVRQVRTPSGDTLGAVAERTHDLAATNSLALTKLNGHSQPAARDTDTDAA